jgi:site-specific DNA-methyltransferase (cytosine-N4-specific)
MILPTTHPRNIVLDPFADSGTTGEVAFGPRRKAILIEHSSLHQAALADRLQTLNRSLVFSDLGTWHQLVAR